MQLTEPKKMFDCLFHLVLLPTERMDGSTSMMDPRGRINLFRESARCSRELTDGRVCLWTQVSIVSNFGVLKTNFQGLFYGHPGAIVQYLVKASSLLYLQKYMDNGYVRASGVPKAQRIRVPSSALNQLHNL